MQQKFINGQVAAKRYYELTGLKAETDSTFRYHQIAYEKNQYGDNPKKRPYFNTGTRDKVNIKTEKYRDGLGSMYRTEAVERFAEYYNSKQLKMVA